MSVERENKHRGARAVGERVGGEDGVWGKGIYKREGKTREDTQNGGINSKSARGKEGGKGSGKRGKKGNSC